MEVNARALWITGYKKQEIRTEQIHVGENSIIIDTKFTGISSGTERLVHSGSIPLNLYEQMKVPYQMGDFSFPIKYGYSLVGQIVQGENHGKYVHIMHPHQDTVVIEDQGFTILPNSISPKSAVVLSNLETALNGVWDSKVSIGDRVAVIGFGSIGFLVSAILKLMNIDVHVIDLKEERLSLADKYRYNTTEEKDYDIVFNCSGSGAGLQKAIEISGFEAKIVELSWYGTNEVNLSLGGSFHSGRKQIISSQVSNIPSDRIARWDYKRRKDTCLDILRKIRIPTAEVKFDELDILYSDILYTSPMPWSTVIY